MLGLVQTFRKLFQNPVRSRLNTQEKRRLEVELLEDRCLLSGNVAPMLSGRAFIDAAHTGRFHKGDPVLPGVTVTLTGTTYLDTHISATTKTNAHGVFQFLMVPNGTYRLSFHDAGFLVGSAGIAGHSAPQGSSVISGIVVGDGDSVTGGHLAFRGLDPSIISERMFLSSATASAFPSLKPGAGSVTVTGPFVRAGHNLADVHLASGASRNIDLAGVFSAPDITTSEVTFHITAGGKTFALRVELFDAKAPQTVANFLDYVHSSAYGNSIFHRLTSQAHDGLAVLQGGGAVLQTNPTTLIPITITNPGVTNEFSTSNTIGTLAMAQTAGNPNSATDQFFFNLVNNAGALDQQRFTVFGKIVGTEAQRILKALARTPVHDESSTPFAQGNPVPGVGFNQLPLNPATYATNDAQFPTDTTADNYLVVNSIAVTRQNEALTYTVTSSNPDVATAAIAANTSELLTLQDGTTTGTTTITVTATDQFGTSKQISFVVTNP